MKQQKCGLLMLQVQQFIYFLVTLMLYFKIALFCQKKKKKKNY